VNISLIAALDRRRAIGRNNALPWRLPDDLRRFKALTLGKPVLMGSNTARSLGRALPGRHNLVLTRSGQVPFAGMSAFETLDTVLAAAADTPELCVIGGAQIYTLTLPLANRLYLTHVDTVVDHADTWFPEFSPANWQEIAHITHPADAQHPFAFSFVEYQRTH